MNGENEPIPNAAELFLEQTLPVVQEYYVSDAELRHLYRAGITTTGAGVRYFRDAFNREAGMFHRLESVYVGSLTFGLYEPAAQAYRLLTGMGDRDLLDDHLADRLSEAIQTEKKHKGPLTPEHVGRLRHERDRLREEHGKGLGSMVRYLLRVAE